MGGKVVVEVVEVAVGAVVGRVAVVVAGGDIVVVVVVVAEDQGSRV